MIAKSSQKPRKALTKPLQSPSQKLGKKAQQKPSNGIVTSPYGAKVVKKRNDYNPRGTQSFVRFVVMRAHV